MRKTKCNKNETISNVLKPMILKWGEENDICINVFTDSKCDYKFTISMINSNGAISRTFYADDDISIRGFVSCLYHMLGKIKK